MLEEEVVLVRNAADAAEDGAFHEMIDVGAETVDDVVVILRVNVSIWGSRMSAEDQAGDLLARNCGVRASGLNMLV